MSGLDEQNRNSNEQVVRIFYTYNDLREVLANGSFYKGDVLFLDTQMSSITEQTLLKNLESYGRQHEVFVTANWRDVEILSNTIKRLGIAKYRKQVFGED
jgi:hypothetical protein